MKILLKNYLTLITLLRIENEDQLDEFKSKFLNKHFRLNMVILQILYNNKNYIFLYSYMTNIYIIYYIVCHIG